MRVDGHLSYLKALQGGCMLKLLVWLVDLVVRYFEDAIEGRTEGYR